MMTLLRDIHIVMTAGYEEDQSLKVGDVVEFAQNQGENNMMIIFTGMVTTMIIMTVLMMNSEDNLQLKPNHQKLFSKLSLCNYFCQLNPNTS